jgi:hypothetical protein
VHAGRNWLVHCPPAHVRVTLQGGERVGVGAGGSSEHEGRAMIAPYLPCRPFRHCTVHCLPGGDSVQSCEYAAAWSGGRLNAGHVFAVAQSGGCHSGGLQWTNGRTPLSKGMSPILCTQHVLNPRAVLTHTPTRTAGAHANPEIWPYHVHDAAPFTTEHVPPF